MRVLVDKYIPLIKGILEQYAEVEYLSDDEFTHVRVKDADALIIRTTVKCDKELLSGSCVKFIATATIGVDHIDEAYCRNNGIAVYSCPGCNAQAVCDYVAEALDEWQVAGHKVSSLGVVGVGNVGSLVADMARRRGITVLLNDPPKKIGVELVDIMRQCDVVTFHTPLTRDGEYKTYHLANAELLGKCKPDALIINAARGGIIDEKALLESGRHFVLDCWEGEPEIDINVVRSNSAFLTSYHIAGYSVEGKTRATEMCIGAFMSFFGIESCQNENKCVSLQAESQNVEHGDCEKGWLGRVSNVLKAEPQRFRELRKQYKLR